MLKTLLLKNKSKETHIAVSLFYALILTACSTKNQEKAEPFFRPAEHLFYQNLDSSIYYAERLADSTLFDNALVNFQRSRDYFKKVEMVLSFTDSENYKTLIASNLLKVEEEDATDIKIKKPQGYQVLEETLDDPNTSFQDIKYYSEFLVSRLKLVRKTQYFDKYQPYHLLWMIRSEVIRVAFTGITGFDSPVLLNSLDDAILVYQSIGTHLNLYESQFDNKGLLEEWNQEIEITITSLSENDFNEFDRYSFLKERMKSQLDLWNQTTRDWKALFPFELAVANDANDLFSKEAFNLKYFSSRFAPPHTESIISLGRNLFNDPSLSGNGQMSCSSCHQKDLAFTDGLLKSLSSTGEPLKRNAPSMTYAGFQKGFFFDKRSGSLEGQVLDVVINETEFHSSLAELVKSVEQNPRYQLGFDSLFEDGITRDNIQGALANYIRDLAPFSSKFDQNIRGEISSMTEQEIIGFNLFMGQAACATCHFPPFFNGTVPPDFKESEIENLGVPQTSANSKLDPDLGRYDVFKTEERKHFFKTPSIRNATLTAPYMHNGVYDSLEQVMEFYNAGGGTGLGLDVPLQTLPSDSLNLSKEQIDAIIAFMKTLTDTSLDEI